MSVTAPLEVVNSLNSDSMQLCDVGCPETEILNLSETDQPISTKSPKMSELKTAESQTTAVLDLKSAQKLCSEYNITDFYLDSCVFDLMLTNDLSFRDHAYLALRDLWQNDPKASRLVLKNCTSWPCEFQSLNSASNPSNSSWWHCIISFILMLTFMY